MKQHGLLFYFVRQDSSAGAYATALDVRERELEDCFRGRSVIAAVAGVLVIASDTRASAVARSPTRCWRSNRGELRESLREHRRRTWATS